MLTVRHQQILALLNDQGNVSAGALKKRFGVTAMTVWRDLRALEELGLLRRVRGGALAVSPAASENPFEEKSGADIAIKRQIAARAAAKFIRDGDTIALEGGTTVAALVDFLPSARISLLTNSLPVALKIRAARPEMPVRVTGGWLSPVSGNLTGPEALREIGKLSADVCFLSATSFDGEVGPSDPNPMEIEAKRAWAAVSRRTVLLLDSRKFGLRSAAVTIHPKKLSAVVTDAPPPPEVAHSLKKWRIPVWVVSGARHFALPPSGAVAPFSFRHADIEDLAADGCQPYGPIRTAKIACGPHSQRLAKRICGEAACPRLEF